MNLINNGYGITLAFVRACAMKVTELMLLEIRKEPPRNMDKKKRSHVDYACGWNNYSMRFMGLWPREQMINPSENMKVFAAIFFMFFFVSLPQTINLFFIWALKGLLNSMEEDRKEATRDEDIKRMMIVAEISRKITITANIMCNSLVVFYGIMHLATNYTSARGLFFPAYFPWETKPSPYYEITFFGQLMGSFYACATYSVVDTFVATLVLHVCGQLANLRHELINLRRETKEEFQAKLGGIVKKHDYLNEFTETIENSFNSMLLIQMLGCTITLCLESFQTLEFLTGEKDKFFLLELGCTIFYVCYILIQLYLYCYVGEKLLSESTGIADAAYECEWFNLSPNEAKCLILIMRRARSPLRITAGKFCSFNHELFSEVVKTSMSYLSVLYAVKNEE
ncbi:odorant receptor 13a-like [Vespula maculifrons]|uniref:Odorant receptor n=1 Tax=Vespula maculifrons TaxID=7453 RepID=A0ABD2C2I0_VESMC